jgi:hypothetical protein
MIFAVFLLMLSNMVQAQRLELGEEEFFGKKEQPGQITFITRAKLDDDKLIPVLNLSAKIRETANKEIFNYRVFHNRIENR